MVDEEDEDGAGPGPFQHAHALPRSNAARAVAAKRSRLDKAMAAAAAAAAADAADDEDEGEEAGPSARSPPGAVPSPPGAPCPSAPITIRLVASEKRALTVRLRPRDTFAAMFAAFMRKAVDDGWAPPGATARFVFDGEALAPTDTPALTDVGDGCAIDVFFSGGE